MRIGLLAGISVIALALPASSSSAAVTIGSDFSNPPSASFMPSITLVQIAPGSRSFVSPIDGVVVLWRVQSPGGSVRPRVLRSTDGGATFTGVGTGPVDSANTLGIVAFPISPGLPIKAGDFFAADQLTDFALSEATAVPPSAVLGLFNPPLADGLSPMPPTGTANQEVLVNADVEPDGDLDRYGDETQDACPNQGGLHVVPCSLFALDAVTVLKKGIVTVTASIPGAGTVSAGAITDKSLPARVAKKKKRRKAPPLKSAAVTRTDKAAGQVTMTLTPTARTKKKLKRKGRLGVGIKVVYAPAGGAPAASQTTQRVLQP